MAMSSIGRNEYIQELRKEYRHTSKKEKGRLLTAAEQFTGMHRKAVVRALRLPSAQPRPSVGSHSSPKKRGPRLHYNAAFHDALLVCWHAANDICAERLQPFLPALIPCLERHHELSVSDETRRALLEASISTIARHLGSAKRRSVIPLGTTKPGSLLKQQIAVRKGRWEETKPGWVETDTVAHGGDSAAGQFIYTYNFVDIATAWVELEAVIGKGERATVHSLRAVRERFPFPLLGIDSDNGGEFITYHLQRYCQTEGLSFTRSRPYQKNDNAHVEQKNWEAVRKMVGYARLDTDEQRALLSELYSGPLRLYLNYFQPTRKRKIQLIDTTTGQKRTSYFEAKTPCQRVMESVDIPQATKDLLQSEYSTLNPTKLLADIREILTRLRRDLR